MLRPQYRGVPPLAKVRAPHSSQQTGEIGVTANADSVAFLYNFFFLMSFVFPRLSTCSNAESSTGHMNNLKRGPQLRQPQPLLYITTTGAGSQRTRRHWAITQIYPQHQHWHPEPADPGEGQLIRSVTNIKARLWGSVMETVAGRLHTGLLCDWLTGSETYGRQRLLDVYGACSVLSSVSTLAHRRAVLSSSRDAHCERNTVLMFVHYEYIQFGNFQWLLWRPRKWNIKLTWHFYGAQPHSNAVIENGGKRLVLVGKGIKAEATNGNVKTV